jgi:hypothetical protein
MAGSIRTPDSIAKVTKASVTTLTLASSRISIGALQYTSINSLMLNTTTIGAGGVDVAAQATSLYYIYAVVSNGALALIGSLNSSLPSGFTQGKVVGGFTTNGSSQIDVVGEYPGNLSVAGTATFGSGTLTAPIQNYLINGGLDFWQRATTGVAAADGYGSFVADRWRICDYPPAGYTTFSRSATPVSSNTIYSGTVTTSNTALTHWFLYQIIESANMIPLIGKTVTLSAKIKRMTNVTAGNMYYGASYLNSKDTAGGSFINGVGYTAIKAIQLPTSTIPTDSYTTISCTFSVPANAANGVAFYVGTSYMTVVSTGDIFSVGEVMLNVGSTAAPFQRAGSTIGNELALCQRYYEKSYAIETVPGTATFTSMVTYIKGSVAGGGNYSVFLPFKVTKRTMGSPPSTTFYSADSGAVGSWRNSNTGATGSMLGSYVSSNGFLISNNSLVMASTENAYGHWTIDFEI